VSVIRVYLTGRIRIENGDVVVDQAALPGRQGRLAFAYLAIERRAVPRDELADILWHGTPPSSADVALSAIVSKTRAALRTAAISPRAIHVEDGCYALQFPSETWIDIDAAFAAMHAAEAARRSGDLGVTWTESAVAYQITTRPVLWGEDTAWAEEQRARWKSLRARAIECLAECSLLRREIEPAVALAEELVRAEPFRETAYQLLMRAHVATGNPAEALRTYEQCRRTLAEELGIDPSAEMRALHLELLRQS
jgi:SARP family transcriptional regulator, regulator of embCAB operon